MVKSSEVKLVSYNIKNVEICASAARISTTSGDAIEIFDKAEGNERNLQLIRKVLDSGHKSIIEHVVFTMAFKNVSAFVEQFFIECRLASFTVKSRRYVDFSKLGYYIPPELEGECKDQYCQYMDNLFSAYRILLESGAPKEDARFLLPYSFHSNFYCTINARELTNIIYNIRYGRGKGISELQELADQIMEEVRAVFPCIPFGMERPHSEGVCAAGCPGGMDFEMKDMPAEDSKAEALTGKLRVGDSLTLIEPGKAGRVSLVNKPSDPAGILNMAYSLNYPEANGTLDFGRYLSSERPRELEQLSYSFLISNITLSGITHIVRHRMQSVIIPSIQEIDHSNYIVPDKIKNDSRLFGIYRDALETSDKMIREMSQNERLKKYHYYYALSGNVMDIMTTMNARELMHFIKLRACERAQWEIRSISIDILKQLRASFPQLFNYFGPSCFVTGKCPEGNMTCGEMASIVEKFKCLM